MENHPRYSIIRVILSKMDFKKINPWIFLICTLIIVAQIQFQFITNHFLSNITMVLASIGLIYTIYTQNEIKKKYKLIIIALDILALFLYFIL